MKYQKTHNKTIQRQLQITKDIYIYIYIYMYIYIFRKKDKKLLIV